MFLILLLENGVTTINYQEKEKQFRTLMMKIGKRYKDSTLTNGRIFISFKNNQTGAHTATSGIDF